MEFVFDKTMKSMGVNDILLGNARPDNAQAISQVIQQSNVPFENQKTNVYDLVEQLAYIWLEMIRSKYGSIPRTITLTDDKGVQTTQTFDVTPILQQKLKVKVDVGASTYWAEYDGQNTMANLLQQGLVDVVDYLERMPDGKIPKRQELIDKLQAKIDQANAMQSQEMQYEIITQFVEGMPDDLKGAVMQYAQQSGL